MIEINPPKERKIKAKMIIQKIENHNNNNLNKEKPTKK